MEHFEIGVLDVDVAVEFYSRVMGLVRLADDEGTVYLGCGFDENYDLAVVQGRRGLRHFAVRVDDDEVVNHYERKLGQLGITLERRDHSEPGQDCAIRFALPSGVEMELVTIADRRYARPTDTVVAEASLQGPLDAHHVNLLSLDVNKDAAFLCDVLDFKLSDVKKSATGFWIQAFARRSDQHHDVALTLATNAEHHLHHIAWAVAGFDHMKTMIDRVARAGVPIELGPGRHVSGSSLFTYFWDPGGNRCELASEAALVDPSARTRFTDATVEDISAWGPLAVPASFRTGT